MMKLMLMFLVTVTMAWSQFATPPFQCTTSAGVPLMVRQEGRAELVGDLVLTCSGGVPTPEGVPVPMINFEVSANAPITSRPIGFQRESLLLIDDPTPSEQRVCQGCSHIGNGAGIDYSTRGNVYVGSQAVAPNSVQWLGVALDPPGTGGVRIIRITNVRVDATGAPPTIELSVSVSAQQAIPISSPQQVVGVVRQGVVASVAAARGLECEETPLTARVTYSEGFPTAFATRSLSATPTEVLSQDVPGVIEINESGLAKGIGNSWVNQFGGSLPNLQIIGQATQGTRLGFKIDNIPPGISVRVGDEQTSGSLTAGLVFGGSVQLPDGTVSMIPIASFGGTAIAEWEVLTSDPLAIDSLTFLVEFSGVADPQVITGRFGFAPQTDFFYPRFRDGDERSVLSIGTCQTNLLFPYITNQAGFDTGISIANTSMDPFGTGTQSGACTLHWYSQTSTVAEATPPILPGDTWVTTVSISQPGIQGYMIARCAFRYAHGYAFLSDLGATKLAQGYIALVMDEPLEGSRSGAVSESLSQ